VVVGARPVGLLQHGERFVEPAKTLEREGAISQHRVGTPPFLRDPVEEGEGVFVPSTVKADQAQLEERACAAGVLLEDLVELPGRILVHAGAIEGCAEFELLGDGLVSRGVRFGPRARARLSDEAGLNQGIERLPHVELHKARLRDEIVYRALSIEEGEHTPLVLRDLDVVGVLRVLDDLEDGVE